ncbi:MAG: RIP metalloprotease RseP [Verrucomicrobiota bacterium]
MSIAGVLKFLFILLEVILLFNLVIIVHELGHFLAAKWRGLHVDRFGIWFGKPIWEKKIGGVTYCLGCIPAGGFVSLPQMAPMEAIEGKVEGPKENLPEISPVDKIIVAFAGPLFSMLLAFAFAVIVWGIGRPVSEKETTTTVGYVHKDFPADKVGIKQGDKILEIDGFAVDRFSGVSKHSIMWRIVSSEGETINVKVQRGDMVTNFVVAPKLPETKSYERKGLRQIGVEPSYTPVVAGLVEHSPALKAGLMVNDEIIAVNGVRVHHPAGVAQQLAMASNNPVQVTLLRAGVEKTLEVKPEKPIGWEEPKVGIEWDAMGKMSLLHPNPVEQVRSGVDSMVGTFAALFSPKSDIKPQHLSGPVGIMRIYYLLFESDQGWRLAIWFSVVLNINLAIMNMLPVPVLDGGHITLALINLISRREVHPKILNWVYQACAFMVIGYILYVSFYDVQDLKPDKAEAPKEMKFAPQPAPQKIP